ncbi:hypothetical protein Tco_1265292 [Tanacetum coccineum]
MVKNIVEISSDKVEGSRDWNSSEFQDTANSGGKKETKAMVFHQMDTEEISDRFVAPCFVNGLEAYDGEINLGVEENMFSKEYAVILCLNMSSILQQEEDDVDLVYLLERIPTFDKIDYDFGASTVSKYIMCSIFLEDTKEEKGTDDSGIHLHEFT